MATDERRISLRRTLEQAKHCVVEALSVVEHEEDPRCALDDAQHARDLLDIIIKQLSTSVSHLHHG